MAQKTRRSVLQALGVAAGTTLMAGRSFASTRSEDRYIVDLSTTDTSLSAMRDAGVEVVYDFRNATPDGDGIEFAVVRGPRSAMPSDARMTADREIEIEVPELEARGMQADQNDEPLYGLQWDKQEQDITSVHRQATGAGTRIGVIDDGVLGANPDDDATHPDLPNVRADLSVNFTDDGQGPGALGDDHGTHVAGTAAAVDNGVGVVGMAPDAEVVDLRVFSGTGASFTDVAAATIVGAVPEGVSVDLGALGATPSNGRRMFTGAGCDVVNLSLGSGPIPEDAPGLDALVEFISAAGELAVSLGTLPVASAGNDATDVDDGVVVLPAEAEGYVSVGATGPIGYGWPVEGGSQDVGGFTVERPVDTELPTQEPASYTNYGAEGVDVTAGGGNFDPDAIGPVPVNRVLYDLVLATTFEPVYESDDPDAPANGGDGDGQVEDERPDAFVPTFGFKAGTSFAAPNVAGFAALLYELADEADPEAVREQIESTAQRLPVGRAGETTAPGAESNVSSDGAFDGDQPSAPGSANIGALQADDYRGEGHIDVQRAINTFGNGDGGNGRGRGNGQGNDGRGNGRGN